ncbi:hypothetical protein P3X46_007061 [Hevea brasiliensis]|uniref:Transcription repressor n=1 Tax=Hevea brasiliensis TaxID=3981 RepID=A0ABQ9MW00_HEVBR|nr:hypothetical protein P3X46_007061 [Hevea brasiliensis]
MKSSREYKKQKLQQIGCGALCCNCKLSVSSSEEAAESSSNSDRNASISSLAHAMVQKRLDQMIRETQQLELRHKERKRLKNEGIKFVVVVAMEKNSYDPRVDFREFMVETIPANKQWKRTLIYDLLILKLLFNLVKCYIILIIL